jgi:hypothetical protein
MSGLFIGNPLSSHLTEIFLGSIEMEVKNQQWFPRMWHRYVDDTITIVKKGSSDSTLAHLNSVHPAIKFTKEEEADNSISFLDTRLTRVEGKINIDIFRKPTDAPLCIPNNSHHHFRHKHAAFESSLYRMWRLPLNDTSRDIELRYLREVAIINGYKPELVDSLSDKHRRKRELRNITTLKPVPREKKTVVDINGRLTTRIAVLPFYAPLTYKIEKALRKCNINVCYENRGKLKNILNNGKARRADEELSGIYVIRCKACDKVYVGQTKRRIEIRGKEHSSATKFRQVEKSSVARHCIEEGHVCDDIELIKKVDKFHQLDAYESLYMATTDSLINDKEAPIISKLFDFALR